jgi:hypothetical protein
MPQSKPAEKELMATQKSAQSENQKSNMKRYNLVLPNNLYDEVQALANDENVSVLELLKRFIKIGLVVTKLNQSPNASLIIREGDRERELVFI